jgi:hypothetical protein
LLFALDSGSNTLFLVIANEINFILCQYVSYTHMHMPFVAHAFCANLVQWWSIRPRFIAQAFCKLNVIRPFSQTPTMAGAGEKKEKVIQKGNCANSLVLYCVNSLISFISYSNV